MRILGISCFYHDAAACLLREGRIVAAAEEERFSRVKHDSRFPANAIAYCLEADGALIGDVDYVVYYEKPLLKFERILAMCADTFPRSREIFTRGMHQWLSDKLWVKDHIRRRLGFRGTIVFGEHHVSHAASAYFPSPFDDAAVITADGVGEWTTTTIGVGQGTELRLTHEIQFPHSLGLLYSAFTSYLGFEVNEGEYKVMGMAAYGRPRYVDKMRRLLRLAEDGSFALDLRYFAYHRSLRAISRAFTELFGPARTEGAALEEYADIAASIQAATEEAVLGIARHVRSSTGAVHLCMAGGVALNVLANARVLREAGFGDLWIQPAAGDAGGCVGAATYLYHTVLGHPGRWRMTDGYLGPAFTAEEVETFLSSERIPHTILDDDQVIERAAQLLADGDVIGWLHGRMEFGPRALGARSILASPLDEGMKDRVNAKVKHREEFRPFAPVVPLEDVQRFFEIDPRDPRHESPFMLLVGRVRPEARALIPAVVHVDGTARVQTVTKAQNARLHRVLTRFGQLTGIPVLLNTSFNVQGEPIVRSPAEAFNSYSYTDMDHLFLENALVPASSKRALGPYPGKRLGEREIQL